MTLELPPRDVFLTEGPLCPLHGVTINRCLLLLFILLLLLFCPYNLETTENSHQSLERDGTGLLFFFGPSMHCNCKGETNQVPRTPRGRNKSRQPARSKGVLKAIISQWKKNKLGDAGQKEQASSQPSPLPEETLCFRPLDLHLAIYPLGPDCFCASQDSALGHLEVLASGGLLASVGSTAWEKSPLDNQEKHWAKTIVKI